MYAGVYTPRGASRPGAREQEPGWDSKRVGGWLAIRGDGATEAPEVALAHPDLAAAGVSPADFPQGRPDVDLPGLLDRRVHPHESKT